MSHFAVLVVTDQYPSDEVLTETLQPWHEYECTGIKDQYVVDLDMGGTKKKSKHNTASTAATIAGRLPYLTEQITT